MEIALCTVIKEEAEEDWTYYDPLEDVDNIFATSVKKEPKPEIPLLVLHSLPNVVSSNHSGYHDFNAEGFPELSEEVFKPSPESQKAQAASQNGISARNVKMVQLVLPDGFDEEVTLCSENVDKCSERFCEATSSPREVRSSFTDVSVMTVDAAFSRTHTISRNTDTKKRKRKKPLKLTDQNIVLPEKRQRKKSWKLTDQNHVFPKKRERKKPIKLTDQNTVLPVKRQRKKPLKLTDQNLVFPKKRQRKTPLKLNHQNIAVPGRAQDSPIARTDRVNSECFLQDTKMEEEECLSEHTWVKDGIICHQSHQEVDSYITYKRFTPGTEEQERSAMMNFIYSSQNVKDKNTSKKAQRGRQKARHKSVIQEKSKKKKKKSDATVPSKSAVKKKHWKLTKSESQEKLHKIEPSATFATENAPKLKPKKETKSKSKSKSHKKLSIFASEISNRDMVPQDHKTSVTKVSSESVVTPIIEGKPERKLKPKVYHCEYCPSAFSRMDYLKLHIMHHTNERPFKCDICKKGFRMRWRVRLHRATHFDDKPHKCRFCSYRSVRRDALRCHAKKVHKNVVVCDGKDCLLDHFH